MDYALAKHLLMSHNVSSPSFTAIGLDVVPPSARGGDKQRILNQKESRWIYALQATVYPGLNDSLDMVAFL